MEDLGFVEGSKSAWALYGAVEKELVVVQKVWSFRAQKVSVYRFVGTEEKSWCVFLICCCPSPKDVSSK